MPTPQVAMLSTWLTRRIKFLVWDTTLFAKSSSQGMLRIVNLPVPSAISPAVNNGFHSTIALLTLREGQSWHWCSHQMQADKRGLEKLKRCEKEDVFEDASIGRLKAEFFHLCLQTSWLFIIQSWFILNILSKPGRWNFKRPECNFSTVAATIALLANQYRRCIQTRMLSSKRQPSLMPS